MNAIEHSPGMKPTRASPGIHALGHRDMNALMVFTGAKFG